MTLAAAIVEVIFQEMKETIEAEQHKVDPQTTKILRNFVTDPQVRAKATKRLDSFRFKRDGLTV